MAEKLEPTAERADTENVKSWKFSFTRSSPPLPAELDFCN